MHLPDGASLLFGEHFPMSLWKSISGRVHRPRSPFRRLFIEVLEGRNLPSFIAAASFAVDSSPQSVAAADFNGDGASDLAVSNAISGTVSILLGKGDGSFQAAQSYTVGNGPSCLGVGDFNGDGKLDVAVANSNDSTVSILLGNGNGTFGAPQNYPVGLLPDSIAVGN